MSFAIIYPIGQLVAYILASRQKCVDPPKGLIIIITIICYVRFHTICTICVGEDNMTTVYSSRTTESAADIYLILISGLSAVTIVILIIIIIAMVVALKRYLINNHLH
jgi:hypothetical protein